MALSSPRTIFGIHSITPYNRSTGEFYGTAKVLGGSTFSLTGETISLMGGSSKYAWQVEDGTIEAELAMTLREYPDFGFEVFLGKALTENTGETTGDTSSLSNKTGTSLFDASTGIATATAKSSSEADMKLGKYVIKAVSATTVDVYASTDADFARGTDKTYENDLLKITASPLTITTSAAVEVPGYGIELTGGSGTIALVTADTCVFDVRPINTSNVEATFGGSSDIYPEFGCLVYGQKVGSGNMFEIDIFRLKAIGMPIGFTANEFSEAEITAKAFFDSSKNGVFSIRSIVI